MANELIYAGDTGLTLTATLTQAGAAVGSAIAMTESATVVGLYLASVVGGTAAGTYAVVVKQGTVVEGSGALRWDGTAEVFGAPAADVTTLLSRITGAVALAVDWTTARAAQLDSVAAINAKTANLPAAPAAAGDMMQANLKQVNSIAIQGTGVAGNPWRPV